MDDHEEDGDPWWMLGVVGLGYGTVGAAFLYTSRHVSNPWRVLLTVVGIVPAAAGVWCLLWFVGGIVLVGVASTKHWRMNAFLLICGVLLLAMVADWWLFLRN